MKHDFSKQDLAVAQELPLHLAINPEKSKINHFIAESFKNLEIIEQTYNKSYGSKKDFLFKEEASDVQPETKRKVSQKSESYHRVTNSRKIKTKRTTKENLPRSDFFYHNSIHQKTEDNHIEKLLNDYEALHSMIISNDFSPIENTVIRLSHYGNKKKASKSRQKSLSGTGIQHAQSFYHQAGFSNYKEQRKPLSRSAVVPQVDLKTSVVFASHEDRLLYQARNKQTQNDSKRKLLAHKETLSKYTTPVRTIYLNKSQQSPQFIQSQSSINRLSISTPLRNNKPYLQQESYLRLSCKRASTQGQRLDSSHQAKLNGMTTLRKSEKKNVETSAKKSLGMNNRPKLSVVSSQKKWAAPNQGENVQPIKSVQLNHAYVSKYQSDLKLVTQTELNLRPQTFNTVVSALQSNRQSRSRSGSKKGLSLTQSSTQLFSKSKSQIVCPKSVARLSHNNVDRQKDILTRKLEQKGTLLSKRVQIRIY